MVATQTAPALSAEDRCDRCGAQAYVLVKLGGGSDLLFCAHHYQEHAAALGPLAEQVIDESDRLIGSH